MTVSIPNAYIALGLFQAVAALSGLESWGGLPWPISGPVSLCLAFIPFVGSVIGMLGAMTAWDLSWLQAAGLFFGPFVTLIVLTAGEVALECPAPFEMTPPIPKG